MHTANQQMNDSFILGLILTLIGFSISLASSGACVFILGVAAGFLATYVKDSMRKNYYGWIAKDCHDRIEIYTKV
jgi:hypothetical protein